MLRLWRSSEHRLAMFVVVVIWLMFLSMNSCWSLNDEGLALLRFKERVVSDPFGALLDWNDDDAGVINPCLWFGVECSDGNVVVLNLEDLRLEGTLAPDLGNLGHMKSLILRNNSFYGIIPEEVGKLKELELLDLGCNNFSGPIPYDVGIRLSLGILNSCRNGDVARRRLLTTAAADQPPDHGSNLETTLPPSPMDAPSILLAPSPSPSSEGPAFSPSPSSLPSVPRSSPSPTESSPQSNNDSFWEQHHVPILAAIGCSLFLLIIIIGLFFFQGNKMATVKPWATGLSGQLQKAFVTGVPKLKRSELETACEDFSNVVGSSSIGTVYKGTLSSGVEIAVTSVVYTSTKEWSKNLEAQFRRKIETLSKVNHKNFMNLIGYCKEEEPFTRMMVFEYAPNGTLFEHIHIKEAEHLDWGMRMRIAMGMAYCLEHMHQLSPPVAHKNLNSSAVYLTEDYAAKISNFGVWNTISAVEAEPNPQCDVYSFGVLLFEMITGRLPYAVDIGFVKDWASDYLRRQQPLREMVDQTLESFSVDQLEAIGEVIKCCVYPDPVQRPSMREVTARLREITAIGPDGAIPKLSPLWWAEIEILSTEAV